MSVDAYDLILAEATKHGLPYTNEKQLTHHLPKAIEGQKAFAFVLHRDGAAALRMDVGKYVLLLYLEVFTSSYVKDPHYFTFSAGRLDKLGTQDKWRVEVVKMWEDKQEENGHVQNRDSP